MTTLTHETVGALPGAAGVEAQIDALTTQVAALADELRRQRESRERWSELASDLGPVATGAMAVATAELEELSDEVSLDDVASLARELARAVPTLEALLVQLQAVTTLGREVAPLTAPAMVKATATLQGLDEKGYFRFARSSAGIVDKVVTSFTEEDVEALGDNVVLILNTVKELTQPEIMTLLQRTAVSVQDVEVVADEPPSLFALLRQMRDPQTRRGLARALTMLRSLGDDASPVTARSH